MYLRSANDGRAPWCFGAVAQRSFARPAPYEPMPHAADYSSRLRKEPSFVEFGFCCFLVCYKRLADAAARPKPGIGVVLKALRRI